MADLNIMTTASIPTTMQEYYDRKLLLRAKPKLVFYSWGKKKIVPLHSGKTVRFRRWTNFSPITEPLIEGVIPDGQSLAQTEVQATMSPYGGYVATERFMTLTAVDEVINDAVGLMGQQGGESIDIVTRDALLLGTNVQYANGRTSRNTVTASDVLTVDEIRKAVRSLKKANAPQFMRNGRGYYVAIVTPEATYDLQSDELWQDVAKYSAGERIFDGEIGKLFGVIFVETTLGKIYTGAGASGANVATTLVFGEEAYGVVDIEEGGHLRTIVKPAGSAGSQDPLDQINTVGWKVEGYAAKVLQNEWLIRIEHGYTAA
jgi:N4-gp56 family major capsid protein